MLVFSIISIAVFLYRLLYFAVNKITYIHIINVNITIYMLINDKIVDINKYTVYTKIIKQRKEKILE